MTIPSPCTKVCVLDPSSGQCLGCGRTGDEIAGWSACSAEERRRTMAALPTRLAAAETRRRRPSPTRSGRPAVP